MASAGRPDVTVATASRRCESRDGDTGEAAGEVAGGMHGEAQRRGVVGDSRRETFGVVGDGLQAMAFGAGGAKRA